VDEVNSLPWLPKNAFYCITDTFGYLSVCETAEEGKLPFDRPGGPMSEDSAYSELIAPDIMTPAQWYAGVRDDPRFQGTKRLMSAVLVDALQCLQNCTGSHSVIKRRRLAEVEAWIADREAQGPFAFDAVCEALGINPDYLRHGLNEWRLQEVRGTRPQRQFRHWSNRRSGPIKVQTKQRRAKEAPLADQQR